MRAGNDNTRGSGNHNRTRTLAQIRELKDGLFRGLSFCPYHTWKCSQEIERQQWDDMKQREVMKDCITGK